jgi:hypothetical protein
MVNTSIYFFFHVLQYICVSVHQREFPEYMWFLVHKYGILHIYTLIRLYSIMYNTEFPIVFLVY